jgi:hypothetical protein
LRGGQRVRKDSKTRQDLDETGAALAAVGAGRRDDAYLFSNDPAHSRP